jgi:hypothetical protein
MTKAARVGSVFTLLIFCFVLLYIASDFSDGVVSGRYHLAQNGETSILVLKPNHSFEQELSHSGKTEHAEGSWRRLGEGGIAFSKEFLIVSGQEPGADGTTYGEIHKPFGFLVSIALSQYHVLWYGRVDPSPDKNVYGTYTGDEEGVPATLVVKQDHTFEQTVTHLGVAKHAEGTWSLSQNGDIIFSRDFLKTSGDSLREDETASAGNPEGSNLQIVIAVAAKWTTPIFRKRQLPW